MQVRENAKKVGIGTGVYIKQENEKKKLLTPPAPPSNQEEYHGEIHSQPKSTPDASSDLSPVKEERYEKQEHKELKQSKEQQPKQIKENNGRGYMQENKESQQENSGNINENNGPENENKNVPATQHQGNGKKNT